VADAGVVHEDVEDGKALGERRDGGRVAHVDRGGVRLAARGADGSHRGDRLRLVSVHDPDRGALAGEAEGDRLSDARARARYECRLAV
jgi:hypothetical protein